MGSAEVLERCFLRHPADIPIEVDAEGPRQCASRWMKNVSLGGVACRSRRPLAVGARVLLSIPIVQPAFRAAGLVVWCSCAGADYEIGIRFMEADTFFAARMVEQICHIEHYRIEVLRKEGRALDGEAAAAEWIARYAARFPAQDSTTRH